MPEGKRGASPASTSSYAFGLASVSESERCCLEALELWISSRSSTNVFQSPHSGQRPSHFELWKPQAWHAKTDLNLVMESHHPSQELLGIEDLDPVRRDLPEVGEVRGHEHGAAGAMRDLRQVRVIDESTADFGSRLSLEPLDRVLDGQVDDLDPVEDMFREKGDRGLGGEPIVRWQARGDGEELEATMPGGDAFAEATGRESLEDGAARGVGGNLEQAGHEDVRVEENLL